MPRRERRLSAALDAAAERRASHIAARRASSRRRVPRPSVRSQCAALLEVPNASRRSRFVLALAHHRMRFGDLLALRRCFDEMRAPCDDELPFEDDGLLHAEDIERALRALERDREERRPSRRRSAPRATAPRRSRPTLFKRCGLRRALTFADVIALMYPLSTRRERDALAAAADAALNATGSTPRASESGDAEIAETLFRRADEDGSGELDAEEFREALAQFGFEDKDEQDAMFREIDADGGGTVSWDEFLRWWRGEDDWEPEDEQEGEGEH